MQFTLKEVLKFLLVACEFRMSLEHLSNVLIIPESEILKELENLKESGEVYSENNIFFEWINK